MLRQHRAEESGPWGDACKESSDEWLFPALMHHLFLTNKPHELECSWHLCTPVPSRLLEGLSRVHPPLLLEAPGLHHVMEVSRALNRCLVTLC